MKTSSGRFSKLRGLWASVPYFPLPHSPPSTFLLSPHFSPAQMRKLLRFVRVVWGTLATQANGPIIIKRVRQNRCELNTELPSVAISLRKQRKKVNTPNK